jgi:hypothetical protein
MQAVAIYPPAGIQKTRLTAKIPWLICLVSIYIYLYLLICLGGPFMAFDHENYINFLNEPYPFFFEPLYTVSAFLVNWLLLEEERFPAIFILFTLPPLVIVWSYSRKKNSHPAALLAFACVVTKSFYIGFIAQRFFFAELWGAVILITTVYNPPTLLKKLVPGLIHFSGLTLLPVLIWFKVRFSWAKFILALGIILCSYGYVKFLSGFELFGYSYARYLDLDYSLNGFPFMSLIQLFVLASICIFVAVKEQRINLVALCALVFIIKLLFSDIEVFSRIFQMLTDIIIVVAVLNSSKAPVLLFAYCFGFMILQVFFTPTANEMATHHLLALINFWRTI